MRALILVRVSRSTDTASSPETQRKDCEAYALAKGMTVVGVATDTDVSGSTDPFQRAGLGPWLRDRLAEFDVIIAWKLSRVGRNVRHISSLMNVLLDNGKSLECVHDPIDIGSSIGRMVVNILATLAEIDLQNITLGNQRSYADAREEGRYKGGSWPAGYRAQRADKGWRLTPDDRPGMVPVDLDDPDATCPVDVPLAPVLREVVSRTLAGERPAVIVRWLNEQGVPTPADRQAALTGRPVKGTRWTVQRLTEVLRSPTLCGYALHGGSEKHARERAVVVGDDGTPARRAAPLVDDVEFRRLQRILDSRQTGTKKGHRNALLVQVLFCASCGEPYYSLTQPSRRKTGTVMTRRYRCKSVGTTEPCGNGSVEAEYVELIVVGLSVKMFGSLTYRERVYDPGTEGVLAELADVEERLAALAQAVPRFPAGSSALAGLLADVDALSARKAELEAVPIKEAGYTYRDTGETVSERWERLDDVGRNDLLREFGVRATVRKHRGSSPAVNVEMEETVKFLRSVDPDLDEEWFTRFGENMAHAFPGVSEMWPPGDPRRNGQ